MTKPLFKSDDVVFYIEDDELVETNYNTFSDKKLENIPHLNNIKVLYHFNWYGIMLPVYYTYGNRFITKISHDDGYTWMPINDLIKDYTLVNLNLI